MCDCKIPTLHLARSHSSQICGRHQHGAEHSNQTEGQGGHTAQRFPFYNETLANKVTLKFR